MQTLGTRVVAFYLPQFHTIPENDRWWGYGFSEWRNVKDAAPLFTNHYQPHIPAPCVDYYDLNDDSILLRQADLAQRSGIYGFCFYHYWFKGKKLLEMPIERLLQDRKPAMPFCLCWANEPWTRTWGRNIGEILQPQDYGGQDDWRHHFNYLLPYFNDDRYIRIGGRPLLLIYRAGHIPSFNQMIATWRQCAAKAGLPGLNIIAVLNFYPDSYRLNRKDIDGACEFMPFYGLRHAIMRKAVIQHNKRFTLIDSEAVWQGALSGQRFHTLQFPGAFPSWDNTARRPDKGATVFWGATPQRYGSFLSAQLNRLAAFDADKRLLFVNAWNEWAEGCHLEPDKRHGFGFLDKTRKAVLAFEGRNAAGRCDAGNGATAREYGRQRD